MPLCNAADAGRRACLWSPTSAPAMPCLTSSHDSLTAPAPDPLPAAALLQQDRSDSERHYGTDFEEEGDEFASPLPPRGASAGAGPCPAGSACCNCRICRRDSNVFPPCTLANSPECRRRPAGPPPSGPASTAGGDDEDEDEPVSGEPGSTAQSACRAAALSSCSRGCWHCWHLASNRRNAVGRSTHTALKCKHCLAVRRRQHCHACAGGPTQQPPRLPRPLNTLETSSRSHTHAPVPLQPPRAKTSR